MREDRESIVARGLKGDPDVINEIVDRYSSWIYRIALKVVRNVESANDVVQDVALKILTSLATLRAEEKLRAWIARTTKNVALNRRRSHVLRRTTAYPAQLSSPVSDPLDLVIRREEIDLLRDAIERLPPRYREVVDLFYDEGLSVDEIAERLGLTEQAVKNLLFRARERIGRRMRRGK